MKKTFAIKIDELEKIIREVKKQQHFLGYLADTIEFEIKEPAKWHNESDSFVAFCQSAYAECFPKFIYQNFDRI